VTARFVLVVVLAAACHHPAPPPAPVAQLPVPTLPVESPWVGTLAMVQTAVDSGQFAAADSMLADFEKSDAELMERRESAFWRAMMRADPRNPAFTPAGALRALEEFAAGSPPHRQTETGVMLRLLAVSDSLRAAQASQRTAVEQRDRLREEEMQKLRDELARTQAELDRIKRRLGPPKP
jgi:hypothetical protein